MKNGIRILMMLTLSFMLISCGEEVVESGSDSEVKSKNEILFDVLKNYKDGKVEENEKEDCTVSSDGSCTEPSEENSDAGTEGGSAGTDSYGAMPLCPEIMGLDFSTCPPEKGRPVFIIDFGRSCVLGMKCDFGGAGTECPMVWEPVCGVDGITYDNKCFAGLNKVEIAYFGECKWEGNCKEIYPEERECAGGLQAVYDETTGCIVGFICENAGVECKDIGTPVDNYCGENEKIMPVYDYNGCVISYECYGSTNPDGTDPVDGTETDDGKDPADGTGK